MAIDSSNVGDGAPDHPPLVSVVTPVYNGAPYLAECIESVIGQSHQNWRYSIVDNCSTDQSIAIAERYARLDNRITVHRNHVHVGAVANHNIALRHVSDDSRYAKLLSADDWLYPEFLERLVAVAERYPSVGVVGALRINRTGVPHVGLPLGQSSFIGRETAKGFLQGELDGFWVPSGVLYRADLVRSREEFYPSAAMSADLEACLECLKTSDYGFVHQVLSFERIHDASLSHTVRVQDTYLLDRIRILRDVGPSFMETQEIRARMEQMLDEYYATVLTPALFNKRPAGFWNLHRRRLDELGLSIICPRMLKTTTAKILTLALNPQQTLAKLLRRLG